MRVYYDEEVGEVLVHTESRRAAREHECCVCDRPIATGTHHTVQTSMCDGSWLRQRFHYDCFEVGSGYTWVDTSQEV